MSEHDTLLPEDLDPRTRPGDALWTQVPEGNVALAEVERCAGSQFDPQVARAFLEL